MENGRRKKKFIKSLVAEEGENLSGSDDISEEILKYFRRLYTKPIRNSWKLERLDWSPISTQSVEWLDRPFHEEDMQSLSIEWE